MANYSIADSIPSFGVFAALESRGDGHTFHWSLVTTRYDPRNTSTVFTTYEPRGKWVYEKRTQDLREMDRLVTLVQIGSLIDKLEVSDRYLDSLLCPDSLPLTIPRDDPELNTERYFNSLVWFLAAVRKLSRWGVFRVKHNSLRDLEKELVRFGVAREKQWKEGYRGFSLHTSARCM